MAGLSLHPDFCTRCLFFLECSSPHFSLAVHLQGPFGEASSMTQHWLPIWPAPSPICRHSITFCHDLFLSPLSCSVSVSDAKEHGPTGTSLSGEMQDSSQGLLCPRACGSSRAGEVGGFAYVGPPRAGGSSHAAGSVFGFRSFACRLHGPALSSVLLLVVSWSVPSSTELDRCFFGSSPGPGLGGQRQGPPGRGECGTVGGRRSPWPDGFHGSRAHWAHPPWCSSQQTPGVGTLLSPFCREGN